MGFIDWHGNKQNQYEDILEFAKMKEKMEIDNFGSQMKKKADAKFFGVPELLSMETEEILKLLLKEKKGLDILYVALVQNLPMLETLRIDERTAKQFYDDFLQYSLDVLFSQAKLEKTRIYQFTETILTEIFKVKRQISIAEHYQRIKTSEEYRQYLSRGFELKSGNVTLFWQWIGYLAEVSAKKKEAIQFVKLYQRFMAHLSYYTNQLLPDAEIGRRYAERQKLNLEIIQKSLSERIDVANIKKNISNPIFRFLEEEERERLQEKRLAEKRAEEAARIAREEEAHIKKFIGQMRCAKIIPGYYIYNVEEEKDMITAGRLYSDIKDKKIELERMVRIFPAESAELVERGILPVLSTNDVKFKLNEREILHYVEYAAIYVPSADEKSFEALRGTLFITNQRVQLETGKRVFSVPFDSLRKAVIYDVMPEIIEFASAGENYFVRTADTELSYRIVKMILNCWVDCAELEKEEPKNMEQLTIGFLEKESIEAYIFGIQTMMDSSMPKKLYADLSDMIRALGYLDTALKKYPGYKEQSYSFFSYYIPEAVKILFAYCEYEKAGLGEQEINLVYTKVTAAVQKLSIAAKQQVVDIYKKAIVDTTARAEALAEILGQDGFVDEMYKITI